VDEVKLGRDARQLLQGLRRKTLNHIVALDHRKHSGPHYEYITSASIGFSTREGDDVFAWFEAVDDVDPRRKPDEFVLRVGPSIELRRRPRGPLLDFSDVSHDLAGFAPARVEEVCLLSHLGDYEDDPERLWVDGGLALALEGSRVVFLHHTRRHLPLDGELSVLTWHEVWKLRDQIPEKFEIRSLA
jgi:hypothetical protein